MIQVEQLHFSYLSGPVFEGLDLTIHAGEILSLVGPNGCGKSTFLKLLRGILTPTMGTVRWHGKSASSYSRRAMAKMAAVVAQSHEVNFAYSVKELVMMGRFPYRPLLGDFTAKDLNRVDLVMAITDVTHLSNRPATDLSGGELQRVMLARALAQDTPVLLLDEATSHLDLIHRLTISDLLVELNRKSQTTIVQVSHDLDLAAEISHRILLFSDNGQIAALGKPADVFTSEKIKKVFEVDVEIGYSPNAGAPRIFPLRPSQVPQS
ncbi:MAG: ABC transporter ATP-binding protein [Deltaproteobacteria bacterium]|jgi:iron complex transport system ATP-binding protein|nr:ABC transporter ATP-binding protein [Deltaproteobacteria bacterium]